MISDPPNAEVKMIIKRTSPELRGLYRDLRKFGFPRYESNVMCFGACLATPTHGEVNMGTLKLLEVNNINDLVNTPLGVGTITHIDPSRSESENGSKVYVVGQAHAWADWIALDQITPADSTV